jgi:Tol biopolymer transport system component
VCVRHRRRSSPPDQRPATGWLCLEAWDAPAGLRSGDCGRLFDQPRREAQCRPGDRLQGWDQDLGQSSELVAPERGYTLVLPQWSPDGQLLSFDEVYLMEGRGMFAYYDFEAGKYVAWDEPIGTYSWSPDGTQIAYDGKTYAPSGEERIFLNDRAGSEERVISPALEAGYAFDPVFSPQGDRIAYLVAAGGPDDPDYAVYVQELASGVQGSGEPGSLGEYGGVQNLAWTPDGSRLVFSAGPYESQKVYELNPVDGAGTVLAQGGLPSVAATP